MNNIHNKTWKGFLKKGLVFCMIGVMAIGLVACGGKDKKSDTKAPKTQTEQSTNKIQMRNHLPRQRKRMMQTLKNHRIRRKRIRIRQMIQRCQMEQIKILTQRIQQRKQHSTEIQ